MDHTFSDDVVQALAELREVARLNQAEIRVVAALNTLDDAGVFAALDEQTDYASAESILAEAARKAVAADMFQPDPTEWGDTTAADMAGHQGYAAVSRLGRLGRVPGTDRLRVVPETDAEDLGEPVYGDRARELRDRLRGLKD